MPIKSSTSPDEFAISGMSLVTETANIEITLNLIIWKLLDVPPAYGRPISARLTVWQKTDIIASLLEQQESQHERFKKYKKRLESIYELRNLIVHGGRSWHGDDMGKVQLTDVRQRRDNPYSIAVNPVSLKDIQKMAEKAEKLNNEFKKFGSSLTSLRRKNLRLKPRKKIPVSPSSNPRKKQK